MIVTLVTQNGDEKVTLVMYMRYPRHQLTFSKLKYIQTTNSKPGLLYPGARGNCTALFRLESCVQTCQRLENKA